MNETTNSDSGVETAIPLTFKLPISYLEQKHIHTISEDVTNDLELIMGNSETTEELGMYGHLLQGIIFNLNTYTSYCNNMKI